MKENTNAQIGKITISRQVFDLINRMPQHCARDLYAMIMTYAFTGEATQAECQQSVILFDAVRPFIDMSLEASKQRNEHLRQIALDRWQGKSKKAKKEQRKNEAAQRSIFTPPTLEEVREYVGEIGANINPEYFYNYYKAIGWMVGRNKMKDWRAAVRNWQKRDSEKQGADPGLRCGKGAPWSAPVSAPEDFKDNWD